MILCKDTSNGTCLSFLCILSETSIALKWHKTWTFCEKCSTKFFHTYCCHRHFWPLPFCITFNGLDQMVIRSAESKACSVNILVQFSSDLHKMRVVLVQSREITGALLIGKIKDNVGLHFYVYEIISFKVVWWSSPLENTVWITLIFSEDHNGVRN